MPALKYHTKSLGLKGTALAENYLRRPCVAQRLDVVDFARRAGQDFAACFGHEHTVLDADTESFVGQHQIRLDDDDHARLKRLLTVVEAAPVLAETPVEETQVEETPAAQAAPEAAAETTEPPASVNAPPEDVAVKAISSVITSPGRLQLHFSPAIRSIALTSVAPATAPIYSRIAAPDRFWMMQFLRDVLAARTV